MKHLILIIGTMILSSQSVQAATQCENTIKIYDSTGVWDRHCGPEPGKDFYDEAVKDCLTTVRLIDDKNRNQNAFASWNSEHGWMYEDRCETILKDHAEEN